jgi:preprotein translocase subunit SecE
MADANAVAKTKKPGRIKEFFTGIRTELKKVVWPTKKETYKFTVAVFVTCAFFALLFWLLDTGALLLLEKVLNITL